MNIKKISNLYLNFYSDCIPVKGAVNAAIYDLTRQEIIKIPSVYYDFIEQARTRKIGEILDGISDLESKNHLIEFIDFLNQNEFVNFSIRPELLLNINQKWESPCTIHNAIIDIKDVEHDFPLLISQLDSLACELVQLRYFRTDVQLVNVRNVLKGFYNTSIQGVELIIGFNPLSNQSDYIELMEEEAIISRLTVHSADGDQVLTTSFGEDEAKATLEKSVVFLQKKIDSSQHCGIINSQNLNKPSAQLFLENKAFNGCLNKKISIDEMGMIKNCPSMNDSYGHYSNTEISKVLNIKEFKDKWDIKKDDVSVCKDCEFRYACTDCRAFLSDPQDLLSKPLKCGYDPYQGVWNEWKNNADNAVAIKYYDLSASS